MEDPCASNPCDPDACCEDAVGVFECTCNAGFSGTGLECEGKDILLVWMKIASSFRYILVKLCLVE